MLPLASGVNTIMEPLLQPVCKDRNARLVSVTSKIEAHGATAMSGERHVPLDAAMLQGYSQYAFQIHATIHLLGGDRHVA